MYIYRGHIKLIPVHVSFSFHGCRSAPVVVKHAAEVAQVITNSQQQAALFQAKPAIPVAVTAAGDTAEAPKPDALPSSSAANPSQQAPATAVEGHAAAVGAPATAAGDAAGTAARQQHALAVGALPQQAQQQQAPASSTLAIKPKTLKPIMLAKGSSAFGMGQPKRPALAQGTCQMKPVSAVHTAPVSGSASPSPAVMTHLGVSQALALNQHAVNQPSSLVSDESLVTDGTDVQISTRKTQSQATAMPEAATAAASTAPSIQASEQAPVATGQHPSAISSAMSKQSKAVPQIKTAAGGLFGVGPPRAAVVLSQGTAAAGSLTGNSPQSQEPDLAAVHRLRAQFALPFAVAPAEGQTATAKAGKRQQPEGQEPLDEAQGQGSKRSPAEGIRAVVNALQAEKPSDGPENLQPASKKQKGMQQHCYRRFMLVAAGTECSILADSLLQGNCACGSSIPSATSQTIQPPSLM